MKIAIIPARGGSKRIPRKNIKDFCGRPMIEYSIRAALGSNIFDEVMVSTDDAEIADISRACGAQVPFMRSEKTSDDYATTNDVILEVLEAYKKRGREFDIVCCIYPTAPFITAETLREGVKMLKASSASSIIPVIRFSFPPQRGFVLKNGYISPANAERFRARSQDLEPMYHECGLFYIASVADYLKNKSFLFSNSVPFIMKETEVQDIDTEEDWKLAEMKFKLMKGV